MLSRRADGHMPVRVSARRGDAAVETEDCLHWCLPGAYDIGAQLLFNWLEGRLR